MRKRNPYGNGHNIFMKYYYFEKLLSEGFFSHGFHLMEQVVTQCTKSQNIILFRWLQRPQSDMR